MLLFLRLRRALPEGLPAGVRREESRSYLLGLQMRRLLHACKSERGCKHCETVCENCGEDADPKVCSKSKNFVWFDWMPGCAKIHTKTKLMKKIETVTVPSYKWVVEDMCPQCAANAAAAKPGTIVYAAPTETATTPANEEESIFSLVRLPSFLTK